MPQKSSGAGFGGQRSGPVGGMGIGGRGLAGNGGNRPSGPDQVAQYSGLRPNGSIPPTGVLGGIASLGRSIFTGDAYGQYGEPDMPAADISTRDSTMGSLRGNTGGRDFMGGGVGGGAMMPNYMQRAMDGLRLRGANDQQLKAYGFPVPQAPNQVRADLLRSTPAETGPKDWWRTPFPAPNRTF